MKKIQIIIFIIFLNNCTTQKGACEREVKNGEDALTCNDAALYLAIGSTYTPAEGKRSLFNDLGNFQLLRCLRFTLAKRECKDKSTIIPGL